MPTRDEIARALQILQSATGNDRHSENLTVANSLTWFGLLEMYFLAHPDLAETTTRTLRSLVRPLDRFWAGIALEEFGLEDADQFRQWRIAQRSKRGGPVTIQSADDSLRRGKMLLEFACERQLIPSNPLSRLKRFSRYQPREIVMTPEQVQRLLAVEFPTRWGQRSVAQFRALIIVMWSSGCRIGEALKNRWENVHDGRLFAIPRRLSKSKKHRQAWAAMSWSARATLEEIRTDSPYLFPALRGKGHMSYKAAWRRWRYAVKAAGLDKELPDAVPHCLRHTAASELIEAGVPAENVQMVLRHASLGQTRGYVHLQKPMIAAAADELDRYRRKGPKRSASVRSGSTRAHTRAPK